MKRDEIEQEISYTQNQIETDEAYVAECLRDISTLVYRIEYTNEQISSLRVKLRDLELKYDESE